MSEPNHIVGVEDGIARVVLNRPEVHNALDDRLITDLMATFKQLGRDPGVRLVILSGQGGTFCAGGDLNWMRRTADFSFEQNMVDAMGLARMLQTLNSLFILTLRTFRALISFFILTLRTLRALTSHFILSLRRVRAVNSLFILSLRTVRAVNSLFISTARTLQPGATRDLSEEISNQERSIAIAKNLFRKTLTAPLP